MSGKKDVPVRLTPEQRDRMINATRAINESAQQLMQRGDVFCNNLLLLLCGMVYLLIRKCSAVLHVAVIYKPVARLFFQGVQQSVFRLLIPQHIGLKHNNSPAGWGAVPFVIVAPLIGEFCAFVVEQIRVIIMAFYRNAAHMPQEGIRHVAQIQRRCIACSGGTRYSCRQQGSEKMGKFHIGERAFARPVLW